MIFGRLKNQQVFLVKNDHLISEYRKDSINSDLIERPSPNSMMDLDNKKPYLSNSLYINHRRSIYLLLSECNK
jgi:hypothetical protein